MGIFVKKSDEATKPLPEPLVQTKVEEGVEDTKIEAQAVDEAVEDRSAFNCQNCHGDGLVYHAGAFRHERCPNCGGTGKVN